MKNSYIYIFVMAAVTYAVRVIPLTLIKGKTENRFLKSFLYYVPYVTLAVMTFPAILSATESPVSAAAALIIGIGAAYAGLSLFYVAAGCTAVVLIFELFIV
ncbi:MAG: AzlD domain-containing protein [Clostridiales bacterium]|nr:AzlD domain-containing protein [Clostridiales bacterium]